MFATNPLVGVGLERFGRLFTIYRPLWHARDLPGSLTSSAHSMWLGLLVSGGLLLLIPVLGIAIISAYRSLKIAFRSDALEADVVFGGLVVATIAVWMVAVEQPSTIFVSMLLFGLGLWWPHQSEQKSVRRPADRYHLFKSSVAIVFVIVSVSYAVRISLGNKAQVEAFAQIFEKNDVQGGIDLLNRAVSYGPTPSEAVAIRGNLFAQLGLAELAVNDALRAAEAFEYSGRTPIASAEVLIQYGRLEEARRILLLAIEKNPGYVSIQEEASALLESIGSSG